MQVNVYTEPGQGYVCSVSPRGLNEILETVAPEATVYMSSTSNEERFREAKERHDGGVIVVSVPASEYGEFARRFDWRELADVPLRE